MQLCHPATLADWIRARNDSLLYQTNIIDRIDIVAEIFDQIVNGLYHVHEQNIVHRDNAILACCGGRISNSHFFYVLTPLLEWGRS